MHTTVQIHVQVPAGTPEEAAKYINAVLDQIDADVTVSTGSATTDDAQRTIDDALAYFRRGWPQNFPYLRALHDGLIEHGYEAKLPQTRADSRNKYPYIRYVRADGTTLGSANTGSFIFWGKRLQQVLGTQPGAQVTRDGVRFSLDSDQKVGEIIALTSITDTALDD